MKRSISIILLISAFLICIFPVPIRAADPYFDNPDDFVAYLVGIGKYKDRTEKLVASWTTYRDYGQVVYGDPHCNDGEDMRIYTKNPDDKHYNEAQCRYLGYNYDNVKVTNTYFREDAIGQGSSPATWTYEVVDRDNETWGIYDVAQQNHMKATQLSYSGNQYSITVNSIGGTTKAKVQTEPSWMAGFSVYTEHYSGGSKWYATLTGPKMASTAPSIASSFIAPAAGATVRMAADADYVDVPIQTKAVLTVAGTYINYSQVERIETFLIGCGSSKASGTNTVSYSTSKRFYRSDYAPGSHIVTLETRAEAESIFKRDSMFTSSTTRTITLVVEERPDPYIVIAATVNPQEKKVDGTKDEPLSVSINASIANFKAPLSYIKSWTLTAELDGVPSTLQTKTFNGSNTSASNSFNFTVSKSNFTDTKFIQLVKVRAIIEYHNSVNGAMEHRTDQYKRALFYKDSIVPEEPLIPEDPPDSDEPPPPSNIKPVAVITADKEEVRMGDWVGLSGEDSFDPDGYIERYDWFIPEGETDILSSAGYTWFNSQGRREAHLRVYDNDGASGYTSKIITVIKPFIYADIEVTGCLKENRKVTISALGTDSPDNYPINVLKTTWDITLLSGGTVSDIKYSGSLTGVMTKDILFKKAGTYKVTVTVTNTANYSDTVSRYLTIEQDLPPIADFSTITSVYRNKDDYSRAAIKLYDKSYSLDGDPIFVRCWYYKYDSNNNGSFDDEDWILLDSGNKTIFEFKTYNVGKYIFHLAVFQDFGQPTIAEFITIEDYLVGRTPHTPTSGNVVEVVNIAPQAGFEPILKQNVDLVFAIPDTYDQAVIQGKINNLVTKKLLENGINPIVQIKKYESLKPSPTDDTYHYLYDRHDGLDAVQIRRWVKGKAGTVSLGGGCSIDGSEAVCITKNNYIWICIDAYVQVKINGRQVGLPAARIYKINGNNGAIDIIHDTTKDAESLRESTFIDFAGVDKYGTAYWSYKGVNYACTETSYSKYVSNSTDPSIHTYAEHTVISPQMYKHQWGGGNGSKIYVGRTNVYGIDGDDIDSHSGAERYSKILLGRYYPYPKEQDLIQLLNSTWWGTNNRNMVVMGEQRIPELCVTAELLNTLSLFSINYNILSTDINRINAENIINTNVLNKGVFIDMTDMDAALSNYADAVIAQYKKESTSTCLITLDDEVDNNTFYSDYELDAKYQEQWKITHTNPFYYENSMGIMSTYTYGGTTYNLLNNYIPVPVRKFSKVGEFEAALRARDNPKDDNRFDNYRLWSNDAVCKFYVHRKPVPQFAVIFDVGDDGERFFNIYESSYDLDHLSRADKGIVKKEWKWKGIRSAQWINGLPPDTEYDFYLCLEVTDVEGVISRLIKYIGYRNTLMLDISPRCYTGDELTNVIVRGGFPWNYLNQYIEYSWSHSSTVPETWVRVSANRRFTQSALTTIPSSGVWYLHARAYYNSYGEEGLVEDVAGPYTVNQPPIVYINPTYCEWTRNDLKVEVAAPDPDNNLSHIDYVWSTDIDKPSGGWLRHTEHTSFVTQQTESNIWYLWVEAFDLLGASYLARGGPYRIDKNPPAVDASPQTSTASAPITVLVTAKDTGGSGLGIINYKWTNSTAKPASGWSTANAGDNGYSFNTSVSTDGTWYLHMEAFDNAGNSYYRYRGPYIYEGLEITDVTIEGYWNHWRGQVDMFGKPLTNEPHRFLSLECVKINIYTVGEPDHITIRFSPELETMKFTDPYGNVYDYNTDFFGYSVYFPDDTTFPGAGSHLYWEYYLPLAKTTKGWDDRRVRPPYSMTVTAYKGDTIEEYTIPDIDITGNIYDLTYIQPVN